MSLPGQRVKYLPHHHMVVVTPLDGGGIETETSRGGDGRASRVLALRVHPDRRHVGRYIRRLRRRLR